MKEDKSQLSSTRSFLDCCSEHFDQEILSSSPTRLMATPISSTSTVSAVVQSSTASNPALSPTSVQTATMPTTQPPFSGMPILVSSKDPAAKPLISSAPASSTSAPLASTKTATPFPLSSTSLHPSTNVLLPAAAPMTVLPTGSPSKNPGVPLGFDSLPSSSTAPPAFDFWPKPTGPYPFGPKKIAARNPATAVPGSQMHTLSQPSVTAPAALVTAATPPVVSRPPGYAFAIPGPNPPEKETTSWSFGPPPAVDPAPSTPAAPAKNLLSNTSLKAPFQTHPVPVPATSQWATSINYTPLTAANPFTFTPPAPIPAASPLGMTLSSTPLTAATPFTGSSPVTTTGSAAPKAPFPADCKASMLVKQLQAQIQPLKQRTLLGGLLSHFTIPDTDSIGDNNKCHVCLEPFLTGSSPELPIKLPCGHICGSVCILKWLAPKPARPRESNCPICRKPIYGIECASEWNALTSLETMMLGMPGKLQAKVKATGNTLTQSQSRGLAVTKPIEAEIPAAWGKGLLLQTKPGHDEMQWKAWTDFLEELVRHVESADEWMIWYFRRQLVIPIINMVTVHTFIDMKKKGYVWVSRVIGEVPELYLPLHGLLYQDHPDYRMATPGEEQYRKTADFHARVEARGCSLWSCPSRPYLMTA